MRKRQWSELAESQANIFDGSDKSIRYSNLDQDESVLNNRLVSISQLAQNARRTFYGNHDTHTNESIFNQNNFRSASPNSINCASALSLLCGVSFVEAKSISCSDDASQSISDFINVGRGEQKTVRRNSISTNGTTSGEDSTAEASPQSSRSSNETESTFKNEKRKFWYFSR